MVAGFQVSLSGRFWVSPEEPIPFGCYEDARLKLLQVRERRQEALPLLGSTEGRKAFPYEEIEEFRQRLIARARRS